MKRGLGIELENAAAVSTWLRPGIRIFHKRRTQEIFQISTVTSLESKVTICVTKNLKLLNTSHLMFQMKDSEFKCFLENLPYRCN